ncbi:niemann-Pick type C-related protein 1 [Cryptotrichosporon argae]
MFGAELPCPDDGPAEPVSDEALALFASVCGPAYEPPSHVCCTSEQLETLGSRLQQAAPLIASCPACSNNFRALFCDFTCSPDQATFLSVTKTQKTTDGRTAVKAVEYAVNDEFKDGFFESCRSVQFGATNGFAMEFLGGGANNSSAFVKYLGDERPGLGSPFQIDFPEHPDTAFSRRPLGCDDNDINARCVCADCPSVCPSLPYVAPPHANTCRVGAVSCLTFSLLIIYSVAILAGLLFYSWKQVARVRQKRYERVALLDPPLSPGTNANGSTGLDGLVGRGHEDADSGPSGSIHFRLGRGASLLNPMEHLQPKQNKVNAALRRLFYRLGLLCARNTMETFAITALVVALINIGWKFFAVETDPVRLWVSPSSESAQEKAYFDESFGPFYRTEQIFVTTTTGGSPLEYSVLDWWLKAEAKIAALRSGQGYTLQDVCFAPGGRGTPCAIESVSAWLGNDMEVWGMDGWQERLINCAGRPAECLPDFGQPMDPKLILGGTPEKDYLHAKALTITIIVDNHNDDRVLPAEDWERALRDYLNTLSRPGVRITYNTGISLEEEINKSTNTDVKIVVLSYLVMFLYVSLTLGGGLPPGVVSSLARRTSRLVHRVLFFLGAVKSEPSAPIDEPALMTTVSTLLSVNSKFSLGLFGIIIVLVAVSTSIGLFSLLGVRITLIIAEVIPFLVLAVGVDNVFILVHELDRQNALHAATTAQVDGDDDDSNEEPRVASLPAEERVARAVARMGPSILLSSTTEIVAFALGALVPMPAVRNFAIYAAGSVVLGALMQVTVFVSAMTLDLKRAESMRIDCFPCVRLRPPIGLYETAPTSEGVISRFMRRVYAPMLLRKEVKQLVLAAFGALALVSVVGIQRISLGLDQRLALPSDSHLVPFFNDLDTYLDVGPPVYFVARGADVPSRHGQQQMCGRFTTCQDISVANTLEAERKRPASSFLANPPASWIDDFLAWTNPDFESCCRVRRADPSTFCRARDSDRVCRPCFEGQDWDITMNGLPEGADFMHYLDGWLASPANEDCPLGGLQGYAHAIKRSYDNSSITTSHFRTFHKPLRSQDDFIDSLAAARRISDDITHRTGIKVFPYSVFYVFFDQYSYISGMTARVLALALASVFAITSTLLGSYRTGAVVSLTCALAVLGVMGIMGFWGVSLNAISLVNLVISLGIAVEFCSHIARAFMGAGTGLAYDKADGVRERDERAWIALVDVGPSVVSGITLTKLIGISVLALTRSKLLETYYFRMWLALILSGALHGLVLLPVLLSFAGGQGYSLEDTDEDWVTSQMRRPMDYEYAPFADDDSASE